MKKIELYDVVRNAGLGACHLLKKKTGGCIKEVYLFYSEINPQHFIICEGVTEENSFYYARYFSELEVALKEFKTIK